MTSVVTHLTIIQVTRAFLLFYGLYSNRMITYCFTVNQQITHVICSLFIYGKSVILNLFGIKDDFQEARCLIASPIRLTFSSFEIYCFLDIISEI